MALALNSIFLSLRVRVPPTIRGNLLDTRTSFWPSFRGHFFYVYFPRRVPLGETAANHSLLEAAPSSSMPLRPAISPNFTRFLRHRRRPPPSVQNPATRLPFYSVPPRRDTVNRFLQHISPYCCTPKAPGGPVRQERNSRTDDACRGPSLL